MAEKTIQLGPVSSYQFGIFEKPLFEFLRMFLKMKKKFPDPRICNVESKTEDIEFIEWAKKFKSWYERQSRPR